MRLKVISEPKWKCITCGTPYSSRPDLGMCETPSCLGRVSPLMELIGYVDENATCGLYQCRYCKRVALVSSRIAPACGCEAEVLERLEQ